MRVHTLLTLLTLLFFAKSEAKKKAKKAHFSLKIECNHNNPRLSVTFYRLYIVEGTKEIETIKVEPDNNGGFKFDLPEMEYPGRLYIEEMESHSILYNKEIVEGGDNILIDAVIKDDGNTVDVSFSGTGAAKYNYINAIKDIQSNLYDVESISEKIRLEDSILLKKMEALDKFKPNLSTTSYEIIKSDAVGKRGNNLLFFGFYDFLEKFKSRKISVADSIFKIAKESFFNLTRKERPSADTILVYSKEYVRYLYEKEKLNYFFENPEKKIEFSDLYSRIRKNYSGRVREMLLSYCLMSGSDMAILFDGCDPDIYTEALKDAVSLAQFPILKQHLQNLLNSRGKGAVPFDFILPSDSTNRSIKLSDFAGKVVLLDMWTYQCTGCCLFANVFHEKVYPKFRNDSGFMVISIMIGESSKEAYMRRLRREEKEFPQFSTYTFPDYTNLFGGKGQISARKLEQHYNINSFPFILLIGKNGKIYSSTIPFFTNFNSPNVQKLIDLIDKALKES